MGAGQVSYRCLGTFEVEGTGAGGIAMYCRRRLALCDRAILNQRLTISSTVFCDPFAVQPGADRALGSRQRWSVGQIVRLDSLEHLGYDFPNRSSDLRRSIKPENSITTRHQRVVALSCSALEVHVVNQRGVCNRERRRLLVASLHPNVFSSEKI